MTDKVLLKAIGEIDEKFIDEAAEYMPAAQAARRRRARRASLLAACLAVAVGVTAAIGLPGDRQQDGSAQKGSIPQLEMFDMEEGKDLNYVPNPAYSVPETDPAKYIAKPLLSEDPARDLWLSTIKRSLE